MGLNRGHRRVCRWVSERVEELGGAECLNDESRLAVATALAVAAKEALTEEEAVQVRACPHMLSKSPPLVGHENTNLIRIG